MNSIQEYVGAGIPPKQSKKSIQKLVSKKKKRIIWNKEAKQLCRLFYALKADKVGTYFNSKVFENTRVHATFHKLHASIKQYESETCTKVDKLLYLGCHLNWFGFDMYPNQLISDVSWNLYQTHERVEKVPTIELSHHDDVIQQFKMLKKLAQERKEPERVVLLSLKSSGLFSKEFLHQRGIR